MAEVFYNIARLEVGVFARFGIAPPGKTGRLIRYIPERIFKDLDGLRAGITAHAALFCQAGRFAIVAVIDQKESVLFPARSKCTVTRDLHSGTRSVGLTVQIPAREGAVRLHRLRQNIQLPAAYLRGGRLDGAAVGVQRDRILLRHRNRIDRNLRRTCGGFCHAHHTAQLIIEILRPVGGVLLRLDLPGQRVAACDRLCVFTAVRGRAQNAAQRIVGIACDRAVPVCSGFKPPQRGIGARFCLAERIRHGQDIAKAVVGIAGRAAACIHTQHIPDAVIGIRRLAGKHAAVILLRRDQLLAAVIGILAL